MVTISEVFATKAREMYPQEAQLHADIAAGNAIAVDNWVVAIRERDHIPAGGGFRSAKRFVPTTVLEKFKELGPAAFQGWLEADARCDALSEAWSQEHHENRELDDFLSEHWESMREEDEVSEH